MREDAPRLIELALRFFEGPAVALHQPSVP